MTDRSYVCGEQNLLWVLGRTDVNLSVMKLHQPCIVVRRIQAVFSPRAGTQEAMGHVPTLCSSQASASAFIAACRHHSISKLYV